VHHASDPDYYEYAAIVRDLRVSRRWCGRLGYLLAPPGWSPEPVRPGPSVQPATQ